MSTQAVRESGPKNRQFQPATNKASGLLQRKCSSCGNHTVAGGECSECGKRKRLRLQTKLAVSEPGDIYEQEADRIADQVLAVPLHSNASYTPPRIQRFSSQLTGQTEAVPESVDRVLASPGSPLEPRLRQDMEQRFGYDFSRVRVHADPMAAQSAGEVDANAYTIGEHIVFGRARYAPQSEQGRKLIAHELTHTLQQAQGGTYVARQAAPALAQTVVPDSYLERLLIAIEAAGAEILTGLNIGMAMLLGFTLLVSFFAATELGATISAVLASTIIGGVSLGTWLTAALTAWGLQHAVSEMVMAYIDLDRTIRSSDPSREELQEAGRTWGRRTGEALSLFVPVLLRLPQYLVRMFTRSLVSLTPSIRRPGASPPRVSGPGTTSLSPSTRGSGRLRAVPRSGRGRGRRWGRGGGSLLTEEEGAERVLQFRQTLTRRHQRQNIAFYRRSIDGVQDENFAIAGDRSPLGSVPAVDLSTPSVSAGGANRMLDAERKILGLILSQSTPDSTGQVVIYTERTMCGGCGHYLQIFRRLRPRIEVEIMGGRARGEPVPGTTQPNRGLVGPYPVEDVE